MMDTFEVKTQWSECDDCVLVRNRYADNDHIALSIYSLSEGPYAGITVNIDQTDKLPKNFGFVDTNNFPEAPELIGKLGIGKFTGEYGASGFCVYPLFEFDEEAIKKYVLESASR